MRILQALQTFARERELGEEAVFDGFAHALIERISDFENGIGGAASDDARAQFMIFRGRPFGGPIRPATDGFGHRRTDEVSVDLVVKRGFRFVPRPQHAWSEPTHFLYKARPGGAGGFGSFMRSRQQAQQFGKGDHRKRLWSGTSLAK